MNKQKTIQKLNQLHIQPTKENLQEALAVLKKWTNKQLEHDADIVHMYALTFFLQTNMPEAALHVETLLQKSPDNIQALKLAVKIYTNIDDYSQPEKALPLIKKLQQLDPKDELQHRLTQSNCLRQMKETEQAIQIARDLFFEYPDDDQVRINFAYCLQSIGQIEKALMLYNNTYQQKQYDPGFLHTFSSTALLNHDCDLAEKLLNELCHFDLPKPLSATVSINYTNLFLLKQEYQKAYQHYEKRWDSIDMSSYRRNLAVPNWQGERVGQLLIYGEQGIGEQIYFANLIAHAAKQATTVYLSFDPRLNPIIDTKIPNVKIVKNAWAQEQYLIEQVKIDKTISVGSLANLYPNLPSQELRPFLSTSHHDKAVESIRQKLRQRFGNKLLVGLSWFTTSNITDIRALRSIKTESLSPLFTLENCVFFNLQYGLTTQHESILQSISQGRWFHFEDLDHMNDLQKLAIIMNALDLVLTTGNSTLHLAGGLESNCWAMLPKAYLPQYRITNKQIYWYPKMRTFIQEQHMQWDHVIASVVDALKKKQPEP